MLGGVVDVVADQAVVSIAKVDLVAHVDQSSYGVAEGDKLFVEPEEVNEGWEEVDLLDYKGVTTAFGMLWVEHHHRDAVPSVVVIVFGTEAVAAMVGGDDEKGAVEPGLLTGFVEEAAQGVVGVFDAFEYGVASLQETLFVFVGDGVGMVRADGEDFGEEGPLDVVDVAHGVLQERLVEDAPGTVVVLRTAESFGFVFVLAQILVEANLGAELVEVHHSVVCAVIEGGVVAVALEDGGQTGEVVVAVG